MNITVIDPELSTLLGPQDKLVRVGSSTVVVNAIYSNFVKVEWIDVAFFVEAVISVCSNVALSAFIISEKTLRRQKSNYFFINLLHANVILTVGAIVAMFYLTDKSGVINNGFFMQMFFSFFICSADRYINIKFPYKYAHVTKNDITLIIVTSWIVSGAFVMFSLIYQITPYQSSIVCTALSITATLMLTSSTVHLYIIAKRHAVEKLRNSAAACVTREREVLKSTNVCLALVISFIILWLPLSVHNVLVLAKAYTPANEKWFTKVVFHVGFLNSLADPIIYVCLRNDVNIQLSKCGKKHNNASPSEEIELK